MAIALDTTGSTPITSGATSATVDITTAAVGAWCYAWCAITTGGTTQTGIPSNASWTTLQSTETAGGSVGACFAIYRRQKQSGDTTFSFTWTTSGKGAFAWASYTGLNSSTPDEASAITQNDGTSRAAVPTPSATPSAANRWALAFFGQRSTNSGAKPTSWTADAALIERIEADNSLAASSPWTGVDIEDSNGAVTQAAHSYTATSNVTQSHDGSGILFLIPASSGVSVTLTTVQVTVAANTPGIIEALSLTAARVTVNANPPIPGEALALTTAQVTVNANAPNPPFYVGLTTAQVTVTASVPKPPLYLALTTAQLTITANPPTLSGNVKLTTALITVAANPVTPVVPRRLLVALASRSGTDDFGNVYPQGIFASAGVIQGPVFEGPDYILNSTGAFWYSGTPAGGNLIGSIAASSGSDGFGNAYLAGITTYSVSGGTYYAMNLVGQAVSWYTASSFSAGWVALFNINSFLSDYNSAPTMQLAAPSVLLGNLGDCIWSDNGLGGSGVPQLGLSAGGGPFIPGEGWHPISGAAGLSGTFRCKLLPWNAVWIDFEGTISNTSTTFTLGSLPSAAYYPTATRHLPLALTTGATARLFIPTSGAVQVVLSAAANGASIGLSAMYPTN